MSFRCASFKWVRGLALAGLAVAVLPLAGCDRQTDAHKQSAPGADAASSGTGSDAAAEAGVIDRSHAGTPLPAFVAHDPAGANLALASLKGKPVLLNLWATWCAPCVQELPGLAALAGAEKGKLAVVTVSQDSPGQGDKVKAFLASHRVAALPAWLDPDNTLASTFHADVLPTTVLFDRDGKEVWRLTGSHDWTDTSTPALLLPVLGA